MYLFVQSKIIGAISSKFQQTKVSVFGSRQDHAICQSHYMALSSLLLWTLLLVLGNISTDLIATTFCCSSSTEIGHGKAAPVRKTPSWMT
ncbi:hypothetical protein SLEP1_g2262 [Rubroshorea leprosula]|uniref:Uncharacterized protein n=1 Tax=Rubroshorea leprosula TaxID=152421 RepID=A0AAV5HMH0_9ROSI|nr:hypothetical protein SLEP1_g2262 [Rubroshorea leprosula]